MKCSRICIVVCHFGSGVGGSQYVVQATFELAVYPTLASTSQ